MRNNIIARMALAVLMFISSAATPVTSSGGTGLIAAANVINLPEVVITPKVVKKAKSTKVNVKEYFGFDVEGRVDTNVTENIKTALELYNGPEVKITSMKRHWGTKSQHEHGKAIDLAFDASLIEWLVTDEGRVWLSSHNLKFFIEGRPGNKELTPYKRNPKFSEFVFENPNARGRTGNHVHLELIE